MVLILLSARFKLCSIFFMFSSLFFLSSAIVAIAQEASLNGNSLILPMVNVGDQTFRVELSLVAGSEPLEFQFVSASELAGSGPGTPSTFDGVTLAVPSISAAGVSYWANFSLLSDDPISFVLAGGGVISSRGPSIPPSCQRPEQDSSNGPDNPVVNEGFSVPVNKIIQAAAGADAIPSIDFPVFTQDFSSAGMRSENLVVGVKIGDDIRAYPHEILDWHEIVNDRYNSANQLEDLTLSYCPLTGSAVMWKGLAGTADTSFGTSGFLYNSNLVLYDRETQSLWSQMLEQGISGNQLLRTPEKLQVVETTWATWVEMYPQTSVLTTQTGFSRPYGDYPYGNFRTDNSLFVDVDNSGDGRLHRKERVLGVNVREHSKVYPISRFGIGVSALNDRVGGMDVVAAGSSNRNFGVVFNRQLEDCTLLEFSAVQDQLPVIMEDNEGNRWDVFGEAVSGPRVGTQLQKTNSFISYWYAWTAFFPGADVQP